MPITTDLFRAPWRVRLIGVFFCVLVLLGLLIANLMPEWRLNPQYRYGFVMPLLIGLLLWRSVVGLPNPQARDGLGVRLGMFGVVVAIVVVDILHGANPDWRLSLWLYGIVVLLGIYLLLDWFGGWGWYTLGAFALILFAIPWPSQFEQDITLGLMRAVAAVTGEVCNLLGIPVETRGNALRLGSGAWIGVEDACSGVRSLQSGMMAAYFFGRWMRLGVWRSCWLFVFAAVLAFVFNLLRALALTLLAHFRGGDAVGQWHDFAGNSVAFLVFLALLLVALKFERATKLVRRETLEGEGDWVPFGVLLGLVGVPFLSAMWFSTASAGDESSGEGVFWAGVSAEVSYEPIAERSRALLRYSEGEHGWWVSGSGARIDLYDFSWRRGMISSFGEIHRPDVCLPAAGLEIAERDFEWRTIAIGGREVGVERFVFERGSAQVYVFFCAWDLNADGERIPLVTGVADRLRNTWERKRVDGRRVVQVLVSGAGSGEVADREVEGVLRRVLR